MALGFVQIKDATGATVDVAVDTDGSNNFQAVKLDGGAAGASTPIVAGSQTMANSLPMTMASDQSVIPVGGKTVTIANSITRPADTNAYTAGDNLSTSTSVGTYQTFANCARVSGGSGVLTGVVVVDENNAATPAQPVLYLFNAAPSGSTNFDDNAAMALVAADALLCIGVVPLVSSYLPNAGAAGAGVRIYTASGLNIGFKASGTSLFGVLQLAASYTPISAKVFVTQLQILQD